MGMRKVTKPKTWKRLMIIETGEGYEQLDFKGTWFVPGGNKKYESVYLRNENAEIIAMIEKFIAKDKEISDLKLIIKKYQNAQTAITNVA